MVSPPHPQGGGIHRHIHIHIHTVYICTYTYYIRIHTHSTYLHVYIYIYIVISNLLIHIYIYLHIRCKCGEFCAEFRCKRFYASGTKSPYCSCCFRASSCVLGLLVQMAKGDLQNEGRELPRAEASKESCGKDWGLRGLPLRIVRSLQSRIPYWCGTYQLCELVQLNHRF